jgi:hypothetical protein
VTTNSEEAETVSEQGSGATPRPLISFFGNDPSMPMIWDGSAWVPYRPEYIQAAVNSFDALVRVMEAAEKVILHRRGYNKDGTYRMPDATTHSPQS